MVASSISLPFSTKEKKALTVTQGFIYLGSSSELYSLYQVQMSSLKILLFSSLGGFSMGLS